METNYKVVNDYPSLKDFVDWLPDLLPDETYYFCLFARSKYADGFAHISSDKQQLKRFTSNKERMIDKIGQLEIPLGRYKQKDNIVPQEALALYMTVNPRSFEKATKASLIDFVKLITEPYNGWNPHARVMSNIQRSVGRKIYFDIDFDIEKGEQVMAVKRRVFEKITGEDMINVDCITVLNTRGGFHLLIELKKIDKKYEKTWWKNLNSLEGVDMSGDMMIPVPGTYQGGKTPHFGKMVYDLNKPTDFVIVK